MAEPKTDSIQVPVRKLFSKQFRNFTPDSVGIIQLELIARTYKKNDRVRKFVVYKLNRTTKAVIKQDEFETSDTTKIEKYLEKLGCGLQTERCMKWIRSHMYS